MNTNDRLQLLKARYSEFHEPDHLKTHAPTYGTGKGDPIYAVAGRELEHHGWERGEDGEYTHGELPGHRIKMTEHGGNNPEGMAWEHSVEGGETTQDYGRDSLIEHAGRQLMIARRDRAEQPEKYGAGDAKIEKTMHEFKEGSLHSGSKSGPTVENRRQAVAIALSQARKAGANIPKP